VEGYRRRLLIFVDAKGYGGVDDLSQDEIQHLIVRVLDEAAARAGLSRAGWRRQPSGDGELAVLPDTEPEPVVVDDYTHEVQRALARHNRRPAATRLRLRLAIHHGMAKPAPLGFSGQGVVEASRLVASEAAHAALSRSRADLVVIVSDKVFLDTIVQPHTSLRPDQFRRVEVQHKESHQTAWLYLPGGDITAVPLDDPEPPPRPDEPERQPGQSVHTTFDRAVLYDAVFGIRNDHGGAAGRRDRDGGR
jgi:hypothetical protein